MRVSRLLQFSVCFLLALEAGSMAHAQPSPSLTGVIGLNTIPSARMEDSGTVTAGLGTLDPYLHGFLGIQIAEPLHINLRQTGEVSRVNADPDRFYPGIDFKLRLLEESKYAPEIAAYLESAIGHNRMAGEALIASKKYKNFDFTAGMGWGRMGSAAYAKNPLKIMSSHFGRTRDLSADEPNQMHSWFTGEHIGFFGGVEYFTPFEGLSIKADYNADRYSAEQASFDYHAGAPWSIGASYQAQDWLNISLATQGADKIMARLSLRENLKNWPDHFTDRKPLTPMRTYRTATASTDAMAVSAEKDKIHLYGTTATPRQAHSYLKLTTDRPMTMQLRDAAIHMTNHAGQDIEELSITPTFMSFVGSTIHLPRREMEKANRKDQSSAEEIWHNTTITAKPPQPCISRAGDSNYKTLNTLLKPLCHHDRMVHDKKFIHDYKLELNTEFSLSDEDYGALYRTALVGKMRRSDDFGWLESGVGFRLNVADNLRHIEDSRLKLSYDVRSDVAEFTKRTVALEELYTGFTHSFRTDLHMVLLGGYLEEMYAGTGGEILYRPLNSRFALGAEGWLSTKRDPDTPLNLGTQSLQNAASGHVNIWYDSPALDLTLHGKIGRYLAGDFGGTLALIKRFRNGINLEAYATATDLSDINIFGNDSHIEHGLRLSLPIGQYRFLPDDTRVNFAAKPFGRNMGQSINSPLPLFEITEPLSQAHLIRHWDKIAEID